MSPSKHEPDDPIRLAKEKATKPLSQRFNEQADAEERRSYQFKGCGFIGEWLSSYHWRQALMLRDAAIVALQDEQRKSKQAN